MGKVDTRGRRVPVSNLIGICFGGLWAIAGSMAISGTLRGVLILFSVVVTAGLLLRVSRSLEARESQNRMFHRGTYLIAVVLEALAIALAVALLPRWGYEGYLLQAIGVIVGLHFIGLWKASGSSRFLSISAGMCILATGSILVQPKTAGLKSGDALTGLGNALVLWFGAGSVARAVPRPDQER